MTLADDYYTVTQVAKEIKITRQTVYHWLENGTLHGEKVGRVTLIKKSDIDNNRCQTCGRFLVK